MMVDSNVFIHCERTGDDLPLTPADDVFISSVVASELLVGVHRAKSDEQRQKRSAFVDAVLAAIPVLDETLAVARVHARIHSELMARGEVIGAHDLWIAATALTYGHSLLTDNVSEFARVPGLQVIPF